MTILIILDKVAVMQTITASDAKREFGDLLLKAQKAPVSIQKNGKAVAVVLSAEEYEALLAAHESQLRAAIEAGLADIKAGNVSAGKDVMKRLRNRIL
jgi:prevent-host-death family protein